MNTERELLPAAPGWWPPTRSSTAAASDNAHIPTNQLRQLCALDDAGERTLEMAVRRMGQSARALDRILIVARTIAGLARVEAKHVAEAAQHRSLDRNCWS